MPFACALAIWGCAPAGDDLARDAETPAPDVFQTANDAPTHVEAGHDAQADQHDVVPTVDVIAFDAPPQSTPGDADASDGGNDRCMALAEQYATALQQAEMCQTDSDCSSTVCETLCCVCQVYVNPHAPSFSTLGNLHSQWVSQGCDSQVSCGTYQCGDPVSAVCSSSNRCVTTASPI